MVSKAPPTRRVGFQRAQLIDQQKHFGGQFTGRTAVPLKSTAARLLLFVGRGLELRLDLVALRNGQLSLASQFPGVRKPEDAKRPDTKCRAV
jgi:hypothetical protein